MLVTQNNLRAKYEAVTCRRKDIYTLKSGTEKNKYRQKIEINNVKLHVTTSN